MLTDNYRLRTQKAKLNLFRNDFPVEVRGWMIPVHRKIENARELTDWLAEVNSIGEEICDFYNSMGANWVYSSIDGIYITDVKDYIPIDAKGLLVGKKIYLDENCDISKGITDYEIFSIICHELTHYLYNLNSPEEDLSLRCGFSQKIGDNAFIFVVLNEAFTESLTQEFLKYKGIKIVMSYGNIVTPLRIMGENLDIYSYFFNHDFDGFRNFIINLIEKNIELSGRMNPFNVWAMFMEEAIFQSNEKIRLYAFFALLEVSIALTPKKSKEKIFSVLEEYYQTSLMDEARKQWEEIMY